MIRLEIGIKYTQAGSRNEGLMWTYSRVQMIAEKEKRRERSGK